MIFIRGYKTSIGEQPPGYEGNYCNRCFMAEYPAYALLKNASLDEIRMCMLINKTWGIKDKDTMHDRIGGTQMHPKFYKGQFSTKCGKSHRLIGVDLFVPKKALEESRNPNQQLFQTDTIQLHPHVKTLLELGERLHGDKFKGLIVEYDGHFHDEADQAEFDALKRQNLTNAGYLVYWVNFSTPMTMTLFHNTEVHSLQYVSGCDTPHFFRKSMNLAAMFELTPGVSRREK